MAEHSFYLTTTADTDNDEEMKAAVEEEIERMDTYLREKRSMTPMMSMEKAILREYLHAKGRGVIPNAPEEDASESKDT